jgi:hypothetical protein
MNEYVKLLECIRVCADLETLKKVCLDAIENGNLDKYEISNLLESYFNK